LADLLRRPSVTYADVCALRNHTSGPETPLAQDPVLLGQIEEQIEIAVKYQGYIDRQAGEIERNGTHENTRLPEAFDYAEVRGLSFEACQKLMQHRPETIGQASRIPGVTPATISLLMVHLKRAMGRRDDATGQAAAGNSRAGRGSARSVS
jgi:tRNA uridine 5-carboxymethylaminomethyl modification enzyme